MMEGWREYKLDEFVKFQRGFDLPKVNFIKGNVPVYGSTSILGYHNVAKVKAPGVITGRSGTLGHFQYAKEDFWPHNTSLWVKDFKGNNPLFAYYLMQCLDFEGFNSGGAVPTLNRNVLRSFKVDVPPLPTQNKIASILSAYDDLIENNMQRIKLLEEMAQQTYTEWFVRMKFPGHESVEWDEETGMPKGWEKVKIEKCLAKVKSTVRIKTSDVLEEGDIPVIDQSRDFIKGYTNNKEALLNYDCPLIVFGDHTRILKLINFPFARGADGTQVLLSKDKCIPQHFFYFSLMNVDLSNYHYARHFKFLKEEVIIRPIEDIALKFESLAKNNFEAIKNLRSQNQHLKEARDILLPRLMTGMIEV